MIYLNPIPSLHRRRKPTISFLNLVNNIYYVVVRFGTIENITGWSDYPSSLESKKINLLNSNKLVEQEKYIISEKDLENIKVITISGSLKKNKISIPFTVYVNYYYQMNYNALVEVNFDRLQNQSDEEFLINNSDLFIGIARDLKEKLTSLMDYLTVGVCLDITTFEDIYQKKLFYYQQPDSAFANSLSFQLSQSFKWIKGKQPRGYIPSFVKRYKDILSSREYVQIERILPKLFTSEINGGSIGQALLSNISTKVQGFQFKPGSVEIQVHVLNDYVKGITMIMETILKSFNTIPAEERIISDLKEFVLRKLK